MEKEYLVIMKVKSNIELRDIEIEGIMRNDMNITEAEVIEVKETI